MEMWKAKLKENEAKIVGILTIAVGIFHATSYVFKTEKCKLCGNFVDGFWVDVFHRTNYAFWWLLFYTILMGKVKKMKWVYVLGLAVSEYLFVNEFFGNPKDWGVLVIVAFFMVLIFTIIRFKTLFIKK